jgi:hypothetical protein
MLCTAVLAHIQLTHGSYYTALHRNCSICFCRASRDLLFHFACVVQTALALVQHLQGSNCTIAFPLLHPNHPLMQLTLGLPLYGIVRTDLAKELTLAWIVATAIMFVIPPFGWLRPHPYSDFRWNQQRKA